MAPIDANLLENSRRVYFIGIGGVGMSALARVLKHRGLEVSGSDSCESRTTRELAGAGIPVYIGQNQIAFGDSDLIIYSSAIRADHMELKAAREAARKVHHRAEILSSLFNQAKTSVAVTGTHGKTTTSSMISFILSDLGRNPTCLVGGEVLNLGTNTLLGNPDLWVSEVDESDRSHEFYAPNYAVLTNLEEDHLDNYKDLEDLKRSFEKFLANTRNPGLIIYSEDDAVLRELVEASGRPHAGFGFSPSADFSAQNIELRAALIPGCSHRGSVDSRFSAEARIPGGRGNDDFSFGSEFDLYEAGFFVKRLRLFVPGQHNIANALGSIVLLSSLGIDFESLAGPLSRFRGARRRLEIKYRSAELTVIDDYAHHPTEVRASVGALRSLGKPVTVIFQPHRFSRTLHFFKDFGRAFQEADEVILTDIYGAGELNPDNISVRCIYEEVLKSGHRAVRIVPKKEIIPYLFSRPKSEEVIAFIGAGDIGELADEFADRFKTVPAA